MPGEELAEREGTDLVAPSEEELALAREIQGDVDPADIVVPQLKLAQGLTAERQAGRVEEGEFINALTGETFGDEIEFVVADQFKGRFWRDEDGNGRGAQGDVVPWADHPCYGQHFADCPEAEEKYREAVNDGEIEWGKGPAISTTFNFVGFVVGENGSPVPVRLSLMRTQVPAARKLQTFISRLSRTPWEFTYTLKAERRTVGRNAFYVLDVEKGRPATAEERNEAVRLATSLRSADTRVEFEEDPTPEPAAKPVPDREGGLEV